MSADEVRCDVLGLDRLDSLDGPAVPLEDASANALVQGALRRLAAPEAMAPMAPRAVRGALLRFPGRVLVGAGIIAMATAAAAARGLPWIAEQWENAIGVPAVEALPPAKPSARRKHAPRSARSLAVPPPPPALAVDEAPSAVSSPVAAAPRTRAAPASPKPTPRARDLLASANQLRGSKRYAQAVRRYLQIVRAYPATPQARVSRVAAADLKLEHLGDARGARSLYRDCLQHAPGELAAEARFGLARALRALGEREAELRALEEFSRWHPRSPLVGVARRRLQALGAH